MSSELERRLEELRAEYAATLPDRIAEIEGQWSALRDRSGTAEQREAFCRGVHLLAGNAGSYGFMGVSEVALDLDRILDRWAESPDPSGDLRARVDELVPRLRCEAGMGPSPGGSSADAPASTPAPASVRATRTSDDPTAGVRASKTILVVDDDPDLLHVVRAVLRRGGWTVVTCSDPREAAPLVADRRPDGLVLDVNMPGLSGLDVLRELRAGIPGGRLPTLFLSAQSTTADRIEGLRVGADDYLAKPFDPEELSLRLERLVGPPASAVDLRRSDEMSDAEARIRHRVERGDRVELGRYVLEALLGEGSVGSVYRAHDPLLHRDLALKTLRVGEESEVGRTRRQVDSLLREAVTIAGFSHPNIVTIHDVGTDPVPFLALELVEGCGLDGVLRRSRRLPVGPSTWIAGRVCRGLGAAHERGVVHRDIKPGNVLLGRAGAVKVSDFGLAGLFESLEEAGEVVFGTPGYIAPEVLEGEVPTSPRTDLFSLGATLYKMLSGEPAVLGHNLFTILRNTVQEEVVPLEDLTPDVPPEIVVLVGALLERDPRNRPESVGQVEAELRRWEAAFSDELVGAAIPGDSDPTERSRRIDVSETSRALWGR